MNLFKNKSRYDELLCLFKMLKEKTDKLEINQNDLISAIEWVAGGGNCEKYFERSSRMSQLFISENDNEPLYIAALTRLVKFIKGE
jgi:hypothetical protein